MGVAITQQKTVQLGSVDSSKLGTITKCQQISNGSITNHSGNIDPLFDVASASNADNAQPKTITSCNFLMNLLLAESDFSFNPGEQQLNIGFYNAVLSSQTFVLQEPDPPRLG